MQIRLSRSDWFYALVLGVVALGLLLGMLLPGCAGASDSSAGAGVGALGSEDAGALGTDARVPWCRPAFVPYTTTATGQCFVWSAGILEVPCCLPLGAVGCTPRAWHGPSCCTGTCTMPDVDADPDAGDHTWCWWRCE